jgi:hypothetical protein
MAAVTVTHSRFRGVLQIVRFNWPMYLVGGLGLMALIIVLLIARLPRTINVMLILGAALPAWWLVASLIVSHWI